MLKYYYGLFIMVKFFIKQEKSVNLLMIFVILWGGYYFYNGKKEGFPNITFDQLAITYRYPGTSPQELEKLVTRPIENAISSVPGKDEIDSRSFEGKGYITFKMKDNSPKTMEEIKVAITDKIEAIKGTLPEGVQDITVKTYDVENIPIIDVLFSYDSKKVSQFNDMLDRFKNDIARIKGIGTIDVSNNPVEVIYIKVDPKKLKAYEIEISKINELIKSKTFNIPAGNVVVENVEYNIKTINEFTSIKEIKNLVLRANDAGKAVYLKNVAKVEWGLEEKDEIILTEGKQVVELEISKSLDGDILKVIKEIKKVVKRYETTEEKENFEKVSFINDLSFYVKRRLGVLTSNATVGLVLVFLCLILFFNWKITFWTTIGIPFSFCLAIIFAYSLGMTLNMITMFGFIIVIGMVVDDAIVVSENIYHHYEQGKDMMTAAIQGTQEMIVPVFGIVSTTIVAFLPLMFFPGVFGQILGFIPKIVILTILASLVEALIVLPGHIAYSKRSTNKTNQTTDIQVIKKSFKEIYFYKLRNLYENMLNKFLKRPTLYLFLFSISWIGITVFIAYKYTKVEFFPRAIENITVKNRWSF